MLSPRAAHHRLQRVPGWSHGGQPTPRPLARRALGERPSDPGGPERIAPATVDPGAGRTERRRAAVTRTAHDTGTAGREAVVFERIEAFRRRRPRLLDEVVTLAHGAGGKASAALLDSVFLPAFSNDRSAPQTDAAVVVLPSGDRLG